MGQNIGVGAKMPQIDKMLQIFQYGAKHFHAWIWTHFVTNQHPSAVQCTEYKAEHCIFMFIEAESAHGRTVSAVHPTANYTLWYAPFRTHLNQKRGHSVLPAARHVQSTAVCPSSLHLSRSTPVPLSNPMGGQLQTRQAGLCSFY